MVTSIKMPKASVATTYTKTQCVDQIYTLYHKNVYNYIAYRINNLHDAQELACDVFIKAMQNIHSYNESRPMEAWLIAIAKNTVTDYLRKSLKRKNVGLESIANFTSAEPQPEEVLIATERSHELMRALAKLNEKERQVLSMKFATELEHKEIGEVMKISTSQVGVVTHRAIKKLRKYMEVENER